MTNVKELTAEELLWMVEVYSMKVVNYPNNHSYCRKLDVYEREILRRLGGNIEKLDELR